LWIFDQIIRLHTFLRKDKSKKQAASGALHLLAACFVEYRKLFGHLSRELDAIGG
jgi:hypothetical protein